MGFMKVKNEVLITMLLMEFEPMTSAVTIHQLHLSIANYFIPVKINESMLSWEKIYKIELNLGNFYDF